MKKSILAVVMASRGLHIIRWTDEQLLVPETNAFLIRASERWSVRTLTLFSLTRGRRFQPLSVILTFSALTRQPTAHTITTTPAAANSAVIHKWTFQLDASSFANHTDLSMYNTTTCITTDWKTVREIKKILGILKHYDFCRNTEEKQG